MKSNKFLAWGSAQLFFVVSVLVAVVFAILSDGIVKDLHLNDSDLGLLGGVFFVAYALSQLVLGILISRVAAKWILAPTALLAAAGTFLFSISDGLNSAIIARALMGIGLGSTFIGVIYLVGRRFGDRFAFMSSVSQSVTNLCAAGLAIGSAFYMVASFRPPFEILAAIFVLSALLIFIFVDDVPLAATGLEDSLAKSFRVVISNSQFWAATVFYCGTFGTLLAFADLWNIQFQMNFFHHTIQQSAVMNSMIPLGVTFGGLAAGAWAGKVGFVLPARLCALLVVICFVVLLLAPLPLSGAVTVMFIIGCGFGGSTLGLAALQQHLPPAAVPLGTSLVVTAACIFGGVIQPLVGSAVSAPLRGSELFALIHSSNPDFGTYQRGLLWLLASILASLIASFFFRLAPGTRKP